MKGRCRALLLIPLALTLLFGCGGGNDSPYVSSTGRYEEEQGVNVDAWMTESFKKTFTRAEKPKRHKTSAALSCAKNETESFHLSLRADGDISGLVLEFSEEYKGILPEIMEEYYIPVNGSEIPDPIVPLKNVFSLKKDSTKSLLIRFCVSPEAEAGKYNYTLTLKGENEAVYGKFDISLEVMAFSLPEEYFSSVASAVYIDEITKKEGC